MKIQDGDLLLACNATVNPTPSISWTKDGSLINVGGDPRINSTEQNTNLSITNVSRAETGNILTCDERQSSGMLPQTLIRFDVQRWSTKNQRSFHAFTGDATSMVSVESSGLTKINL